MTHDGVGAAVAAATIADSAAKSTHHLQNLVNHSMLAGFRIQHFVVPLGTVGGSESLSLVPISPIFPIISNCPIGTS